MAAFLGESGDERRVQELSEELLEPGGKLAVARKCQNWGFFEDGAKIVRIEGEKSLLATDLR